MPSRTSNRRSRSAIEDDSEADAVRYDSSARSTPQPSEGAKRRRSRGASRSQLDEEDEEDNTFYSVNEQVDDEEEDEDAEDAAEEEPGRPRAQANGAPSEHQPGAIVRVWVQNFVTYEKAEFNPGPNLNMVIGPNGTGKSSLVCAICLGLGYQPNVLGRASHAGEFVKHGKSYAIVEVELKKRPKDSANYVIRLRIDREGNSRKFWINGKDATQKQLHELTRKLRIQIDNLCQFLPQDKVAEFAALNSVDLLSKTLQAAASPDMIEKQDQLKTMYSELKEIEERSKNDVEQLKHLENRQQGLQADVDRLRERDEIQKQIDELENALVVCRYNDAVNRHRAAKNAKKDAQEELKRLQESSAPALQAVRSKEQYHEKIVAALNHRKRGLTAAEGALAGISSEIEDIDGKIKGVDNKRESTVNQRQRVKTELGTMRHQIDQLQKRYDKGSNGFTAADWNTKIREQEHLSREALTAQNEILEQLDQLRRTGQEAHAKVKRIDNQIKVLDSKEGQIEGLLKKINSDVADGYEWLKAHKDDFEKEVFGPPMLCCSVKDSRYSDLVQAMLQADDLLCFTAQTRNDHMKLSDQFYRTMKLSATIRTCTQPLDSFRPPVPQNDLQPFGIEGYAIDYLEGPDAVLAMLCAERKLHTSGVALKDVTGDQFEDLVRDDKLTSWGTGNQHYTVTRRREYGPGAVSTRTRFVKPGQFWKDQPVDGAETRELKRQLAEAKGEMAVLIERQEELKAQREQSRDRRQDIEEEVKRLRSAKNDLQKEYNAWQAIPDKIQSQKELLEQRQNDLTAAMTEVLDLLNEKDDLVLERARIVLRLQDQNEATREAYQAVDEAQVRRLEAVSDIQGLKDKNADIARALTEQEQRIEATSNELRLMKEEARAVQDAVVELVGDDEELKMHYHNLARDRSVEDVQSDIAAEASKLELIHATNPGALREFDERAKKIEKLTRQRDNQQKELEKMQRIIDKIRGDWEPKVDELIKKINDAFSYNFEQISCAGEVGIHKDEDFDKWAIEIKVKFRENETLQKLDQHRQSGGERAVSTIFYLMSLQSMAQAPFRVVDEINQGMDPRNERMVHERMVEIACHEHTSQYFLITPKLLSGLRYDPRMKVLCIASGEHMPKADEGGKRLDFMKCVRTQQRLLAAASA